MDAQVPGGVYLCQVDEQISCGACCGLYNVADVSLENLTSILAGRSERFSRTARTVPSIDAFALQTQCLAPQQRPFAHLHHCPFIGLIGEGHGRVGCLLHPMAAGNHGVDYRGMSYYGGMACRTYFCRTTKALASRWKRILRRVLNHWYLFGLLITEKELLSATFAHLESRLGRPLDPAAAVMNSASQRLRDLVSLKCRWPFRPFSHSTACHYLFDDNAYPKPIVDYERLGVEPSVYDAILREMPSAFESAKELRQAETLLEKYILAALEALNECPAP